MQGLGGQMKRGIARCFHEYVLGAGLALFSGLSGAVSITAVSPQGEVAQAPQLRLKFSEAVVNQGDPRLPDPAQLRCEGLPAAPGSGRWASSSEWLFDLNEPLPAGARCSLQLRSPLKKLNTDHTPLPP